MTYTKKQFLEDVAKEARALKRHATKEELSWLNVKTFDPKDEELCIYGQITGMCRSKRAVELMTVCAKRFFKNIVYNAIDIGDNILDEVNGKKSHEPESMDFVSAIETYIATPDAKNKNLIAFLKDERKDLVL